MSLLGYSKAWVSAFKAGWIATRCKTGCVIDNDNEEIRPCLLHAAEINKLHEQNVKDFNS